MTQEENVRTLVMEYRKIKAKVEAKGLLPTSWAVVTTTEKLAKARQAVHFSKLPRVPIELLRTNLAEILGRVEFGKECLVITKYRRDAAVLLSIEDYEALKAKCKESETK